MASDDAFQKWFYKANIECMRLTSLDLNDLPDVSYRDMFEDGLSPKEAAEAAIEEAGGGGLLDA